MTIIWIIIFILPPAGVSAVTTVTGHRGYSVQIRCPYESGYETYMKYLCRGACSTSPWATKDIPVQSGSTAEDQRFSLDDDTAARVFTITITDLRPEDKGTYWCGIQRSNLLDIYTEVLLLVKLDPISTAVSYAAYSPSSVQPQFTHASSVAPTDLSPSGPPPPVSYSTYSPPSSVQAQTTRPPPLTPTGFIILVLGVSLVVVGIGFGLIARYKWRKSTDIQSYPVTPRGDAGGDIDAADFENDTQANQYSMAMGSVYQSRHPNTNTSDSVYQSLNPNTNQSDAVYQSLNQNFSQSDSVYENLNLNTNQSDPVYLK